jgi:hypothetical protein
MNIYIYIYALTSHRHRSLGGAALSLLRLGKADEKGFERKSLGTSVESSQASCDTLTQKERENLLMVMHFFIQKSTSKIQTASRNVS